MDGNRIVTRRDIVVAARRYLGVKYVHQGRSRYGIDCRGLGTCVAYDLGLADIQVDDYGRQADPRRFQDECRQHLDRIQFHQVEPGDAMTFYYDGHRHFGIITSMKPMKVIHAFEPAGKCVEVPMDDELVGRVRGCWRFRGVSD